MNTPALSAAMSLRLFNPSQMNQSLFVLNVVAKLRRYFQMLVWSLRELGFTKLTLALLQSQVIQNQLINSRDVAGDFLKARDLAHSAPSFYH